MKCFHSWPFFAHVWLDSIVGRTVDLDSGSALRSLKGVHRVSPRSLLLVGDQLEIYFHLGTIAPRRHCNKFSHNSPKPIEMLARGV